MARKTNDLSEVDRIRRAIIGALFSDDSLFDRLALKGGNALRLVHGLQDRASLDLDFSLDGDLNDVDEAGTRLRRILAERMSSLDYKMFDDTFRAKPPGASGKWGGYLLEFKLIASDRHRELRADLESIRRNSLVLGASQLRRWRVEISKFEVFEDKIPFELDAQRIFVYPLELILVEKLRALCQQLPDYKLRAHPSPRARDFYDIHEILERRLVDRVAIRSARTTARAVFQAKDVPIALLRRIRTSSDFHRADWDSVTVSVQGRLKDFDYYFDAVATLAEELEPFWNEQPPSLDVGVSS